MPASKYQFKGPDHYEVTFEEGGKKIGTLRIKPSTILWQSKGKHDFLSVSLDSFDEWISSDASGAKKASK